MRIHTVEIKDKEQLDIARRLANIAEYREPGMAAHRERVRNYTYLTALALGLPSQEAELISFASLLHDVGKAGLSEEIMTKQGDLSPAEWQQMQRHTVFGSEILKGSTSVLLQAGEVIALTHHERWDGTGYPQGLKGEEIPLSSRICAVADVFDALTTRRSYKVEIPVESAFELLKESAGSLFDPKVVAAFLSCREDMIRIARQVPI